MTKLAPEPLRAAIPSAEQIYLALAVATAIPMGFAVLARRPRSARWATYALLLVATVLLVNVIWHLVAAVMLRGYSPGAATAVVVNLPMTLFALRWAIGHGWLSRRGLSAMLLVAVLMHGSIFVVAHVVVRALS